VFSSGLSHGWMGRFKMMLPPSGVSTGVAGVALGGNARELVVGLIL